jgi:hypothetical protein
VKKNPNIRSGGNAMTETNEAFERHASEFWASQDKILDNMQEVAAGWFERRHTGTQAALEAARRMCQAPTPAQLFLEYQAWAMGAFERMMADAVACQGCGIAIGRLVGTPLAQSLAQGGATASNGTPSKIVMPSMVPEAAAASVPPVQPPPVRKAAGMRASSGP